MESLRIEPPVIFSSISTFTEDVEIGGYKIKAHQPFSIDIC
jgi:cytochrome P450